MNEIIGIKVFFKKVYMKYLKILPSFRENQTWKWKKNTNVQLTWVDVVFCIYLANMTSSKIFYITKTVANEMCDKKVDIKDFQVLFHY